LGLPAGVQAKTPVSLELEQRDLLIEGDRQLARRALLLVPRHQKVVRSLLILLHGLAETQDELLGIHAWGERYGLLRAYERLRTPPVQPLDPKLGYLDSSRAGELNRALARSPFYGLALLCPVTPNPYKVGDRSKLLDRYADWLRDQLLPRTCEELGQSESALRIGLDGCSLGGYIALETFTRHPSVFQSLGVVQAAIGQASATGYADRIAAAIARVGPRPLHIETSSGDPYRQPSKLLSERLSERGVPNEFRQSKGPHNQPWLREVGTLEMLLWHDRQLNARVP
jgi:pimeloyl-ACP methyl ester carboxylesterase